MGDFSYLEVLELLEDWSQLVGLEPQVGLEPPSRIGATSRIEDTEGLKILKD